jgi:hypothetical protein
LQASNRPRYGFFINIKAFFDSLLYHLDRIGNNGNAKPRGTCTYKAFLSKPVTNNFFRLGPEIMIHAPGVIASVKLIEWRFAAGGTLATLRQPKSERIAIEEGIRNRLGVFFSYRYAGTST